ncbi:MaoC dehydratase-like protein [Sinobacterium caligoides]|uniref:MaoC dehydratase-like protein n=1 Tax=Sinobacterium caligoides TaxID=933926 RepID=A0A3N2D557_9GAMM|nr:MaoC/PaaZ C-terminal domain-containing protein [Sinobacterium caligoides]ROR94917.1 MaoC dehydratase-like protein [Sinobacterium caligoides]
MQFTYRRQPVMALVYLKAVLKKRQKRYQLGDALPVIELQQQPMAVKQQALARYRKLCNIPRSDQLPLLYPQIMAFPLQMAVLTARDFPLAVLGLVHVENEAQWMKPPVAAAGCVLAFKCKLGKLSNTAKGIHFAIETEAYDDDGLVWRSTMTLLYRCKVGSTMMPREAAGLTDSKETEIDNKIETWLLKPAMARRYALLSRDLNPIHLFDISAKLFSFKQQIMHGMYVAARSSAALMSDADGGRCRIRHQFKKPLMLPAKVKLFSVKQGSDSALPRLELWNKDVNQLHLVTEMLTADVVRAPASEPNKIVTA